jgi:hypothetical protein
MMSNRLRHWWRIKTSPSYRVHVAMQDGAEQAVREIRVAYSLTPEELPPPGPENRIQRGPDYLFGLIVVSIIAMILSAVFLIAVEVGWIG